MLRIWKKVNPPATASASALAHQFQQQCAVSGTAKGKGKIKSGQPLKRSKITFKKGGPKSAPAVETTKRVKPPSPIHRLNSKEREREAERERLGLISEKRKAEIELIKRREKEATVPVPAGVKGWDLVEMGLVDVDKLVQYEMTVEDGSRLAKEYSRFLMGRMRRRQAAEAMLMRLREQAIEALPNEKLKAAALMPDVVELSSAALVPPVESYPEKPTLAMKNAMLKEAAMKQKAKMMMRR